VSYLLHNFMPRAATILWALLLGAVGTCAQTPTVTAPTAAPSREVVDEAGRTVRVPVSPARIVSLAPSLTEAVYALGLQDRLVGDTDFCDYPSEAQKKPKVGGGINPNLEVIASLHPDLVLVTKSFNRLDTVRALDNLGIPSYSTDPHTVDEIISSTEKLADVLGAPDAGKSLADDLQRRLATLQAKIALLPQTRVLFVVWMQPLMSVGKSTFVADALRKAGADSIVESGQDWPQMDLEEVVHLQPDYLVFAESHSNSGTSDFDSLSVTPGWRLLDAVHNHRIAVVSEAVIRPAPRIVSVIESLARQLHPAAFVESPGPEKESSPPSRANPPGASLHLPVNLLIDDILSTVAMCAR
jgi:iron complex transport system substrate-binding protein